MLQNHIKLKKRVTSTRYRFLLPVLVALILLSGCGPAASQPIARVTPLPAATQPAPATSELASIPTAVNDVATAEETATVEAAATSALPATAASTPTPRNEALPAGSARAIAMATDAVMKPEMDAPLTFTESPIPITFDEFYEGFDMRKGLILSDKLKSLDGQSVVMEGYMAPPLKPRIDWFVLTSVRLEFCPFCSSSADWPSDIAVVYMQEGTLVATQVPVRIHGRMEIGQAVDPETGMVSLVRIYADAIELIS